ncbi:MAG: hypothetical protein ACRCXB_03410 [Aeromonadaceae bacterium]
MTKPTAVEVWAANKSGIVSQTPSEWGQGFDYLQARAGIPNTDDHDYPLNQITLNLRWVMDRFDNNGAIVMPDASETVKGIVELATQEESDAGTDDLRVITPLKLGRTAVTQESQRRVLTSSSSVVDGGNYHLVGDITATMPASAGLTANKSKIRFTKAQGFTPNLVGSGSDKFRHNTITDSTVIFNIDAEIVCVWNGTYWEI